MLVDPLQAYNVNPAHDLTGRIDDTVSLGVSNGFASVPPVTGIGPDRRLENGPEGLTGYEFTPIDRPMFACRGTRFALVERLGAQSHAVRYPEHSKLLADYWGPDNQHSFIEISDVTVGTEDPASDNGIEKVWVGGFGQVMLVGADHETNGDFTYARDVSCEDVKYGVRVLAGQSRSMLIERFTGRDIWCVLTNIDADGTHGQFGGHIDTMSVGSFIGRLFWFSGTPKLGPMTITSLKAEDIDRIGDWEGNTGSESSFTINKANINFFHREAQGHAVPDNVMGGRPGAAIIFNAVDFAGTPVLSMTPPDVRLQQACKLVPSIVLSEEWQRCAWNASLGIYCGKTQHDIKTTLYGETDLTNVSTGDYRHPHVTIPAWVERARFPNAPVEILHQRPAYSRPASEFVNASTGLEIEMVWNGNALDAVQAREVGFCAGGAMWNNLTGQVLWIKSVDGSTIQARAITGHDHQKITGDLSVGNWQFIGGGYKSPSEPIWGSFTDGSAVVAVTGTDGLEVGDMIAVSQHARNVFGDLPVISEIRAGEIVLEKPANGTASDVPLFVWIKEPPMIKIGIDITTPPPVSGSAFDSGLLTNGGFEDGQTGWRGYLNDATNLDGVTFGVTPTSTGEGEIDEGKAAKIFHATNPSDIEGFEQPVDVSALSSVSLSGKIDYISGSANVRVLITGSGFSSVSQDYIGAQMADLGAAANLQNMDVSGASEIVVAFRMRGNGDINAEVGKLRLTGS